MKTKLLVLILSAVVLLGGAVGVAAYVNSPEIVAINAVLNVVEDFTQRDEINPLYNMVTQGSLEASASKIEQDGENIMEGSSVSGKIYFSKDALMLQNLDVKLFEDFYASGDIYLSKELIYIKEDEIIGEAYGVKPEEFATDLANSIFAANSGSDYAIPDEDLYDSLTKSTDDMDIDSMQKDAEKLLKKYAKELWKIVCEHAEFTSRNKDVRLNGEKKSARVITIEIDGEAMAGIVEDAYQYLADDTDVIDFIEKYESVLSPYASNLYDSDEYDSLAEAYEAMIQEAGSEVDDLCDELADYDDGNIAVEIVTPKLNSDLLKMSVKVSGDTLFTIDLGEKGMKKTDKISVEIDGVKAVYEIKADKKEKTTATLKVEGEQIASMTINHKNENFKFEVGDYTVNGSMETSKNTTTITLDKITDSWVSYDGTEHKDEYKTDIRLTICEKDKIPKAPKNYNKISDITESDVEKWIEKIGDLLF